MPFLSRSQKLPVDQSRKSAPESDEISKANWAYSIFAMGGPHKAVKSHATTRHTGHEARRKQQ
jgi:hypothetical protein